MVRRSEVGTIPACPAKVDTDADTHRACSRDVSIAMDLLLGAIDARGGEVRFGPRLSYALPVAEMFYLVQAGRVALRADHLAIIGPEPTGEPIAASALTDVQDLPATYPPLTVHSWA